MNIKELPKSINIDKELILLRKLNKQKENIKGVNVFDKIRSKKYTTITDKEEIIEKKIQDKLWKIMVEYCEKGDFEGAKWFVGNSYKEMTTVGKILLFRAILIMQKN